MDGFLFNQSSVFKGKTDIVSALDIPDPSSSNYESTQDIIAVGKFDKSINIYSKKDDKVLGVLKVIATGKKKIIIFFSKKRKKNCFLYKKS
jgi:hypothetical protein